jgi:membrane protease YdiL (CAAX protease family)
MNSPRTEPPSSRQHEPKSSSPKEPARPIKRDLLILAAAAAAALALWYIIFALEQGNFWLKISLSAGSLGGLSLFLQRREWPSLFAFRWRHLATGAASALILYGIFWLGNRILPLILSTASRDILSVYSPRTSLPLWGIGMLLFLVTGPGEELFWRGLLQRRLSGWMHPIPALLLASLLYSLVHIWTLNVPLMLAAFTAGFFWGLLMLYEKSLIPLILSHSLWGVLIFVILPVA